MTTMRHASTFLCVLLGAICIQSITARPLSDSYGWDSSGSSLLSADVDAGLGFAVNPSTNFNDNLYVQLLKSDAFRRAFNEQNRPEVVNNLLNCVGNGIAQEFQIDAYSTLNPFYNAMANVYPGSSSEVYASTTADSLSQALSNILSPYNSYNIANTVANIFKRCAGGDTDYMYDNYGGIGVGANANLGAGLNAAAGLGAGVGAGLEAGLGLGAG
ncbi:hypothetical protein AVEN_208929-1, partial [Araneus ventricosus]